VQLADEQPCFDELRRVRGSASRRRTAWRPLAARGLAHGTRWPTTHSRVRPARRPITEPSHAWRGR